MKNITVFGSINMDIVAIVDRYPEKGETVYGKKLSFIPGGKGANQARCIARLGAKVRLIGKVGKDEFGKTLLGSLEKEGIKTKISVSGNSTSGIAIIGVDSKAENRIIITPGANFDFSAKDFANINFAKGEFVLSNFEVPKAAVHACFLKAKAAGATTLLNYSPLEILDKDIASLTDFMIINEHELAVLSGISETSNTSLIKAAENIVNKNAVLIVTFGAQGSIAVKNGKVTRIGAFKVKTVDTTGAGDSFMGAFAVALAEGKGLRQSLIFANSASALKVTKLGASSMPYREKVNKFLKENGKTHK